MAGFFSRFKAVFGVVGKDKARRDAGQGPRLSVRESVGFDPDAFLVGHANFRRVGGKSIRTVPLQEHRDVLNRVFAEGRQNPIAHRILELRADFIIGSGMHPISEDEELADFLTEFWTDPINDFGNKQWPLARSFRQDGELLGEPLVNPVTGRTRVLWQDVALILDVVPHVKYPTEPGQIRFGHNVGTQAALIVAPGECEIPFSTWAQFTASGAMPVFYFRANQIIGYLRGLGDLHHLVEYVQSLDNASFAMLERILVAINYIWLVKGGGMKSREIDQLLAKLATGKPGESLHVREGVTIESIFPDLKSGDFSEAFRTFKNLILGGAGMPEAWFGDGDSANRATVAEQGTPLFRSMLRAQKEMTNIFESVLDFAVARAAEKNLISAEAAEADYDIQTEPISKADDGKVADLLVKVQASLDYGVEVSQSITRKEAALAFRALLSQIIDVADELPDELLAKLEAPLPVPALLPGLPPPPLVNPDGTPNEGAQENAVESFKAVLAKYRPQKQSA